MFKTKAHINSLDGQMDDITVLEDKGNNHYIVDYRGVKCTAIFNSLQVLSTPTIYTGDYRMTKQDYGYKVCYKKQGKTKWRIYVIVNTYDFALWHVRWYERETPLDRKTQQPLENVTWLVIPIKNFLEYKRLWRGCPF